MGRDRKPPVLHSLFDTVLIWVDADPLLTGCLPAPGWALTSSDMPPVNQRLSTYPMSAGCQPPDKLLVNKVTCPCQRQT